MIVFNNLRYMFPINPSYHGVNGTTTDAKLFGKFGVIGAWLL
jgi:hypothetical protein